MSERTEAMHAAFVVMVTSGTVIEFSPELYRSRSLAFDEAERWAWLLGEGLHRRVNRPFEDRWEVGGHDIRLVQCDAAGVDPTREWWVGTHWSPDGSPDPEAHLLAGRAAAREWVAEEPGPSLSELHETRWLISATFGHDDNESYSVAHLAKVCERLGAADSSAVAEYEVELTGTFVQSIEGRVYGLRGLSRGEIEELVERDWAELSMNTNLLLESSWKLETYRAIS